MVSNTREQCTHNAQQVFDEYYVHLYRKVSLLGQFVPIVSPRNTGTCSQSEITKWLQLHGVDTCFTSSTTYTPLYVEEKADWHRPENFCLEEISNTVVTPNIPGWMLTTISDRLLYGFMWLQSQGIADVFWLHFHKLRAWFKRVHTTLRGLTMKGTYNETFSRLAPVGDVIRAIPDVQRFLISRDGAILSIPAMTPIREIDQHIAQLKTVTSKPANRRISKRKSRYMFPVPTLFNQTPVLQHDLWEDAV